MGKGAKGASKKKTSEISAMPAAAQGTADKKQVENAMLAKGTASDLSIAEQESRFLSELQRMTGLTEVTEDNVRKAMATLTPEQRQELAQVGQGLKEELVTNSSEHEAELELFRKEVNDRADEADLPIEKDGDHLAKKVIAFMKTSVDAFPHLVLLEAIASSPYLVKLALSEARETAAKAEPNDLTAIESECERLQIHGWREGEKAGRPPFVRRGLLLIHFQMHGRRMEGVKLQPTTVLALNEVVTKVGRLLDMLLKFSFQNRWVKAALSCTELQGLVMNGLWDHKESGCREAMKEKMLSAGLKVPKVSLSARADDVYPSEQVTIKVEGTRHHMYSEAELDAYVKRIASESVGDEAVAEAAKEGWWVIGEALRSSKKDTDERDHNSLVARNPIVCTLDQQTLATEITFEAPAQPGEYKVMIHLRSSGCVGVDARHKVTFTVKEGKRRTRKEGHGGGAEEPPPLDDVPELQ